ncbi:MBL fold metallo-hydrolase [Candidatus Uhrbacteria bacterium]|nr:MBL fold metallo-hydrolase [Candidatus Uhrbacteria bacterium]
MKVIALGTGVCSNGHLPGARSQPPGFLLDVRGTLILLDCSEGIRYRLHAAGYDYADIGHVAVTHGHPDHAALPQFIQAQVCRCSFVGKGCRPSHTCAMYLPRPLAEGFQAVWDWHQPENDGAYWEEFTPTFVPLDDRVRVGIADGIDLIPFAVPHGFGRHPAMCFRIETPDGTVAYSGDSGITDALVEAAHDVDLFICESVHRVGVKDVNGYGHLNPREAGDIARRSRCRCLRITHTTGADEAAAILHEVREAGFHGDAAVARDGDVYAIGP